METEYRTRKLNAASMILQNSLLSIAKVNERFYVRFAFTKFTLSGILVICVRRKRTSLIQKGDASGSRDTAESAVISQV